MRMRGMAECKVIINRRLNWTRRLGRLFSDMTVAQAEESCCAVDGAQRERRKWFRGQINWTRDARAVEAYGQGQRIVKRRLATGNWQRATGGWLKREFGRSWRATTTTTTQDQDQPHPLCAQPKGSGSNNQQQPSVVAISLSGKQQQQR